MKGALILADGTIIHGQGFGYECESFGELVFNTSMMGYQEALTDPSYAGQALILTYPLVGNYGINKFDSESSKAHVRGFIVRSLSLDYSHRSSEKSLDQFLIEQKVPIISGVDTRFLVRHIREKGVMPCAIVTSKNEIDSKKILQKLHFDYSSEDFVSQVSPKSIKVYNKGAKKKVALLDFGAKGGIVDELVKRNLEVHVFPSDSSSKQILEIDPSGIMLSNGPGDPAILTYAHKTILELGGKVPIFGICLGNQLLSHAYGGDTFKLKFGHRGSNHAVLELKTNKVSITTQNHGFAVGKVPKGFDVTHINLNDKTVEGLENKNLDIFSVQYHPEAKPGPHDSTQLFDKFVKKFS